MKLIADLGIRQIEGKTFKKRIGLYECSECKIHFEARTETVKARDQEHCNSCASKLTRATIKHNMRNHKLNTVINNMIQRCENKKSDNYQYYGAIGIKVCDEWRNNRASFFKWALENGYEDGLTIDRKEGNKDYSPDNCRWVTQSIQVQNTRNIKSNNTSGYRGVSFNKTKEKWQASIGLNNKQIYLGTFNTAEEAAEAYINYVKENNTEHNYKDYDNNNNEEVQQLANAMLELTA
jgi:DNA-directed RNA polymerase subunit RPC12/RpoP